MGLPLFVAPVESDLSPKAANKSRATSPTHSGVRRNARPDSRERRATIRRAATLREHHRVAAERLSQSQANSATRREPQPVPWIENGFPPDYNSAVGANPGEEQPFRHMFREMARIDDRERERVGEHLNSLFNSNWREEEREAIQRGELQRQGAAMGLWSSESRPRYVRGLTDRGEDTPRPRPRTLAFEPMPDGPVGNTPVMDAAQRPRGAELRRRNLESTTVRIQGGYRHRHGGDGDNASEPSRSMARRGYHPQARSTAVPGPALGRQNGTASRTREINGLGDRDRSLSPEVWDTLLTTLTPDPQPPSAGSSFASTVASQSAGVSSSTSLTGPETIDGPAIDPACDSGCENSDHEGPDYEHPEFAGIRRRRERREAASRRVLLRVPGFNVDGPVDGPVRTTSNSRESSVNPAGSAMRQGSRQENSLPRDRPQNVEDDLPLVVGEEPMSFRQLRAQVNGWVGHLSVGTSDDEQGTEHRNLNRESSAVSANNTSQGEEEWSGMQRIVRSLARREDIPDEWWAEAGLSRTLPQDGTD